MTAPSSKQELQRFLGMMTYLSQFIPHFSEKTHNLRGLLKKDTPWCWDEDYQEEFDKLKETIKTAQALQFYEPKEDLQLEVDASLKGLGATLTQGGKPIAFHSRTLTDCQSRYSNIE